MRETSSAANTVPGIRAALWENAETASDAHTWNDANGLTLSPRTTSQPVLGEILDGWFATEPSADEVDRADARHLDEVS